MDLTTERNENVLSVDVKGRIDGSTAVAFEEAIRNALEETDRAMIMDFRELAYISSAGCQRRSKISPPGRSKTSPLNVMRSAVLGGCPGSP